MQRGDDQAGLGGGASQSGARAYNERLVVSLLRRNGPLPKAELARLTGLSAQTLTLMMRRLEGEGLVLAQEPLRGRIGQPSVPYALNPQGALSFGVKLGRRGTDIVLCDFLGGIVDRAKTTYPYPEPKQALRFIQRQVRTLRARAVRPDRVIGLGLAMPFELWKWASEVDAPQGMLDRWRDLDVAGEICASTGLTVLLANDATAACGAELARIETRRQERHGRIDMLYFFVGTFMGGGVVLGGAVHPGRTGNAGALGSMPVNVRGRTQQLINHASLVTLEKALWRVAMDPAILQHPDRDWSGLGKPLADWIDTAGAALAGAIVSALATIDFQRVVIDGALPRDVLAALIAKTKAMVANHDQQGLSPFEIVTGTLGADARALGGALLPIRANFGADTDVMLKTPGL